MDTSIDSSGLTQLLAEGEELGLDVSLLKEKLARYTNDKNQTIKIVLLGSFSDGKTSVIAGLLGQLEENMKIDSDESSDELAIYRTEALGAQFEIVDTPGLFGTKEKEVDGKNVRFSEITEHYISEAHIVMYVTNATNTLKDSHKEIIKRVLRDYNKLENTIFVINKMDEEANINDEEAFAEKETIKRGTFVERLKQVIDLTPEEEQRLHIACVAANPKGKGLSTWFQQKEKYEHVSHLNRLKSSLEIVAQHSDIDLLRSNTDSAVIKEATKVLALQIASKGKELNIALTDTNASLDTMFQDLGILKQTLVRRKGVMTEALLEMKNSLLRTMDNVSTRDELNALLEYQVGISNNQVDSNVLLRRINQTISECMESNNALLEAKTMEFEKNLKVRDKIIQRAFTLGLSFLKNVNASTILKGRDLFFNSYRFKPGGAKKVADNLAKAATYIEAFTECRKLYDEYKLQKSKDKFKGIVNDLFKEIFVTFDNDEAYYKNFAPSFLQLEGAVNTRKKELQNLNSMVSSLHDYKTRLTKWYGSDIEDAVFEEI